MANRDRTTGKDIEKNEKFCETFDVKEKLYCVKELVKLLKVLKNNKAPKVIVW